MYKLHFSKLTVFVNRFPCSDALSFSSMFFLFSGRVENLSYIFKISTMKYIASVSVYRFRDRKSVV